MIPLVSFRKLNAAAAEIDGGTVWSGPNFWPSPFDSFERFVVRGMSESYPKSGGEASLSTRKRARDSLFVYAVGLTQ